MQGALKSGAAPDERPAGDDVIEGGAALPGFRAAVSDLFPD